MSGQRSSCGACSGGCLFEPIHAHDVQSGESRRDQFAESCLGTIPPRAFQPTGLPVIGKARVQAAPSTFRCHGPTPRHGSRGCSLGAAAWMYPGLNSRLDACGNVSLVTCDTEKKNNAQSRAKLKSLKHRGLTADIQAARMLDLSTTRHSRWGSGTDCRIRDLASQQPPSAWPAIPVALGSGRSKTRPHAAECRPSLRKGEDRPDVLGILVLFLSISLTSTPLQNQTTAT
jgi:hypothetical protein